VVGRLDFYGGRDTIRGCVFYSGVSEDGRRYDQKNPEPSQDLLFHESEVGAEGARDHPGMGRIRPVPEDPGSGKRAPHIRAARRASLRQRQHSLGDRSEQDPQGFHRQVQDHGRVSGSLSARLGLPRAAHRDQGRQESGGKEEEYAHHRHPGGVQEVRASLCGDPAGPVPPPGHLRRMGGTVPHH